MVANETMKKVKADVRKGMAEVGKTAANLKAGAKAEVTRIQVAGADAELRPVSGKKIDDRENERGRRIDFRHECRHHLEVTQSKRSNDS